MSYRQENPCRPAVMFLGDVFGWSQERSLRLAGAWRTELGEYDAEEIMEAARRYARTSEYMPKLVNMLDLLKDSRSRDLTRDSPGCDDCGHTGTRHLAWHRTDEHGAFHADTYVCSCDCDKGRALKSHVPWKQMLTHWQQKPNHIECWYTDQHTSKLPLEAQVGPERARELREAGGKPRAGSSLGALLSPTFGGQP